MEQQKKLPLPLSLVLLDAVGTVLLGLGLAEWLAGTGLMPEALRFDNYAIVMVVTGLLLILPLLAFILRKALGRSPREI